MAITEYQPGTAFPGVIARTADESTPAWPAPKRAAEDAPNVVFIVLDDTGYGHLGCLRQPDLHTEHRRAGRGRPDVRQHEYHCVVLAVAVLHPQRAQPSLQPPGVPDQWVDGLPRLRWIYPVRERIPLRDPARTGLQHLLRREVAPGPRGDDDRGWTLRPLAAGAWIRALLRLFGRRYPPVLPRAGARQFADRTRDHARAGLPPDPRPGGEGDGDDRRRQAGRAEQAVLPVLRTGCDAFAPPRAQGVGRSLRRQVRQRLGGLPPRGVRPAEAAGPDSAGIRALRARPRRCGLGDRCRPTSAGSTHG